MTDLVESLRDGYAGNRPFPLNRVDRGTVIAPIYAIHDYDLRALLAALEAKDKELAVKDLAIAAMARTIYELQERAKVAEARAETAERDLFAAQQALLTEGLARNAAERERDQARVFARSQGRIRG